MKNAEHHAIEVRLGLWKTFFETGIDVATDGEYDPDMLIALALDTDDPELQELANDTDCLARLYLDDMGNDVAPALAPAERAAFQKQLVLDLDAILGDFVSKIAPEWVPDHSIMGATAITLKELDTALASH